MITRLERLETARQHAKDGGWEGARETCLVVFIHIIFNFIVKFQIKLSLDHKKNMEAPFCEMYVIIINDYVITVMFFFVLEPMQYAWVYQKFLEYHQEVLFNQRFPWESALTGAEVEKG